MFAFIIGKKCGRVIIDGMYHRKGIAKVHPFSSAKPFHK